MFVGKRANMGMTIFLLLIVFNIFMYFVIYSANNDATLGGGVGSGTTNHEDIDASSNEDLSMSEARSWADGFKVSVFNMPWWVDIFYVTLQSVLLGVSIYAMIRGLN